MQGLSQLSNFSQELALQEQGVQPTSIFQLGGPYDEEDETPGISSFGKPAGLMYGRAGGLWEQTLLLKGCVQNPTCSEYTVEAVI